MRVPRGVGLAAPLLILLAPCFVGCGRKLVTTADRAITRLTGLTVRFLDVGQGDAALLQWEGHAALIDVGPAEAAPKLLGAHRGRSPARFDYGLKSSA